MMSPRHPVRLGFRARLSLAFLLVFVASAAVLLAVEYTVVSTLFDNAIASSFVAIPADQAGGSAWLGDGTGSSGDDMVMIVTDNQLATREDVLNGLVFWSALSLVAFTLFATAVAWWMTGGPVRRIRDVTAMARRISERDLSERLSLGGPHDEIRALGDTFDTMLARLETSFRSRSEFIANASHELKTPLATARAALQVPLLTEPMTDPVRIGIERAVRANHRSEKIINALLDLARAGERRTDAPQLVGLAGCIAAELGELADDAREVRITLRSTVTTAHQVQADPVLLGLMLRNLLANAIRYNVVGGSVTVTSSRSASAVEVTVSNTGPVVTDDVADLVKPFHRGSSSRIATGADSGSGLGLAIVSAIALEIGATVTLLPAPAGGLTVTVMMPVAPSRRLET